MTALLSWHVVIGLIILIGWAIDWDVDCSQFRVKTIYTLVVIAVTIAITIIAGNTSEYQRGNDHGWRKGYCDAVHKYKIDSVEDRWCADYQH